jgi:hypothetical protein
VLDAVVAVMFVPALDMLLAIVRRTRAGRSPFSPDKMHLHHRLLQIGHSHRRAVLLIYLWVGVVALGAASTIFFDPRYSGAVMLAAIAVAVVVTVIPLLRGDSTQWREFLLTEMSFHTANYFMPQRTVRDDRYKLLLNLAPRADRAQVELFDLQTDPEETKNLAGDRELDSTQRRLEQALDRWREQTGDPLIDPARLERWRRIADEWKNSAPRLEGGDYPDVARVPQGGLELLK